MQKEMYTAQQPHEHRPGAPRLWDGFRANDGFRLNIGYQADRRAERVMRDVGRFHYQLVAN